MRSKRRSANYSPQSKQDELVVEEYWPQYIDQGQLDALTEEILEELEKRLCAATGQASWPVLHRIADTADKAEFFRRLRPFYQNNRKLFGTLVTPLVQGIRVRGRFAPPTWAAKKVPTWVLLDGQGVGHEQGGATKINRTVPPELAKKFSGADLICLVDRAVPAMTGDAPILLENLIVRGHQDRLALIFTHFENVAAPDLDRAGRKAKVLEGLSNAIQSIASLPKAQRVLLERTAESKTYFLARLDQPEVKYKFTQAEMKRICDHFKRSAGEPEIPKFRPLYNEYQIANVLRREIEAYRQDWSEGGASVLSLENHGGTDKLDRPRLQRRISEAQPVSGPGPLTAPRCSDIHRAGVPDRLGSLQAGERRRGIPDSQRDAQQGGRPDRCLLPRGIGPRSPHGLLATCLRKYLLAAARRYGGQEPWLESSKTGRNCPAKGSGNSRRTFGRSLKRRSQRCALWMKRRRRSHWFRNSR